MLWILISKGLDVVNVASLAGDTIEIISNGNVNKSAVEIYPKFLKLL